MLETFNCKLRGGGQSPVLGTAGSFLRLNAIEHTRRQMVDFPEEGGERPQLFIGIKRAVGGHGGISYAVFDDPVHFRLRVLSADRWAEV